MSWINMSGYGPDAAVHQRQKKRGVYKGRPATIDFARTVALHRQGMGPTEVARELRCSRGAVYKVLSATG